MTRYIIAFLILATPSAAFAGSQTYSTPGTYTFTVPNFSTLTVTVNGAGGGGGGPYLHPGGSSFPGQPGGASSIAAWSLYGYGGSGGNTVRYNTYPIMDGPAAGNSLGYDQSGSDGAGGTASGGTTNTTGGGGAGGGRWYPLPCGYDYAAGNSCEVHSGAGGAGGKAIKTYTAGDLGAPAADSQVSVVVGSGGSVGQYAYPGFPLPTNGSAGSVVITWTDPSPATCSVTLSPNPINEGGTSTLTWSSANADTWTYITNVGYLTGSGGSFTVAPLSTTDYSCYAQGSGGSDGWHSAILTVRPVPTVSLTATPTAISSGGSSTLTWSSAHATSCTATNFTVPSSSSGSQTFSSSGSFTVPLYSSMVVQVWGGGGGGGVGVARWSFSGSSGGASSFNGTQIAYGGGGGASAYIGSPGSGGGASGGDTNLSGGNGSGMTGGSSPYGGAGGASLRQSGSGPGGGGAGGPQAGWGQGGGGGGYSSKTYGSASLTLGSSVAVVVGSGGAGGRNPAASEYTAGSGASGSVAISWTGVPSTSGTTSVSPTANTVYTLTCTGDGGSASASTTITVSADPCVLDGVTVAHGASRTFYSSQTAPVGQQCSALSQSRTCTDGTLSGSGAYQYASCSCAATYSCSGNTVTYTNTACSTSSVMTCTAPSYCSAGLSSCVNPEPVVTEHLRAAPTLVPRGRTARLYWDVTNVQSCTVTGDNGDSWTGLAASASGEVSSAITERTTFTLSCEPYAGATFSDESATVNLVPVFNEN